MRAKEAPLPPIQRLIPSSPHPSLSPFSVPLSLLRSYFVMHFDTNPPVLSQLSSRFKLDPRVVKWTTLKLGDKLHEITPQNTAGGVNDLLASHERAQGYAGKNVMGGGKTIV